VAADDVRAGSESVTSPLPTVGSWHVASIPSPLSVDNHRLRSDEQPAAVDVDDLSGNECGQV